MLNDKIDWKDVGIGAAATALGVGTAIALKRTKHLNAIQRLSKGKLNWVTDTPSRFTTDRKNIIDKAIGKLMYGDTKFYRVENAKDLKKLPRKLEGATYYELGRSYDPKLYPKSNISYNKETKLIDDIFQNKVEFARLKGDSIAKGDRLSKKLRYPKDYATFVNRVSKKKNTYIKPSTEYASKGKSHISSKELQSVSESLKNKKRIDPKLNKKLRSAYKDQSNYVIQEEIPVDRYKFGPAKGQPKSERRIDFIYRKGKVTPIQKHRRWVGLDISKVDEKQFKHEFENLVKQNPKIRKASNGEAYILGADVVKDKNKKLRIIEVNDQSGFIDPTVASDKYVAHRLFKRLTGKETGVSRIGKGTAVGLGSYTAGDLVVENK